jgi:hypothetical protein
MATWEFEHTPFAIIWQPNTKGVIIMLDKILDILNLKRSGQRAKGTEPFAQSASSRNL